MDAVRHAGRLIDKSEIRMEQETKKPKPGTFQKGMSGNPAGRPKIPDDVKDAARQYTVEAIDRLAAWMRTDNPKASVTATVALLNRAWGMPGQAVEMTGKDGGPLQVEDARKPIEAYVAEFVAQHTVKI